MASQRGTRVMLRPMSSVERPKAPQGAPKMPSKGLTQAMQTQLYFNRKARREMVRKAGG